MSQHDRRGVWVTRPDPNDPYGMVINLRADPECKVPLVSGQRVRGYIVKQTRLYTIRELKELTSGRR